MSTTIENNKLGEKRKYISFIFLFKWKYKTIINKILMSMPARSDCSVSEYLPQALGEGVAAAALLSQDK